MLNHVAAITNIKSFRKGVNSTPFHLPKVFPPPLLQKVVCSKRAPAINPSR